jgi:thiol-disulfide isomerase/thioredoxin
MLRAMRAPAAVLIAALACAAASASCSRGRANAPTRASVTPSAAARAGAEPVVAPMSGIELKGFLRGARGRPLVLNVWATWCGPCRAEFPGMLAAIRRHPQVRLALVSADFDGQLPAVRGFLAQHGVADTTYLKTGSDQDFIDALSPAWSGALPATLVLDASGRKVAFWEGEADTTRFEAAIARALDHPTNGGTP